MTKFLAVITALAAIISVVMLIGAFDRANSAPQQAAGAALAIGTAVIPYVLLRAVQLFSDMTRAEQTTQLLNQLKGTYNSPIADRLNTSPLPSVSANPLDIRPPGSARTSPTKQP